MEENRKKDGNIIKEFRRGKIISLKTQKRTIRNEKTKNSPSSTEGKSDTPIDNKQESRIMNDKEMFNLNSDEWIILDEWNKNDSEPTENEKLIQELNEKSILLKQLEVKYKEALKNTQQLTEELNEEKLQKRLLQDQVSSMSWSTLEDIDLDSETLRIHNNITDL